MNEQLDVFDLHLGRTPFIGRASITYQCGPDERGHTLNLDNDVAAGSRGDPLTGEQASVTLHSLCNEDPANVTWVGLDAPWTIPQKPSTPIVGVTVVIKGLRARVAVRHANGECGPWEERRLAAGLPASKAEQAGPGHPCRTEPCPD